MGGRLGFTIRENDGTLHTLDAWTNRTPHYINNLSLIKKEQDHICEIVDGCDELDGVYPYGYGLVVVDLKENVIAHSQGYTSYGSFHFSGVSIDYQGMVLGGSTVERLKEFYENDKIVGVSSGLIYADDRLDPIEVDTDQSFEDFLENVIMKSDEELQEMFADEIQWQREFFEDKKERGVGMWASSDDLNFYAYKPDYVIVDMSPFRIKDFGDGYGDEMREFKSYLEDIGYEFSETDKRNWNNHIER